jgi:exodeoxyribonuclease V beta subunit
MSGPQPASLPEFDPNGFPLGPGVRLLEASAGTGKTFALAHLVLRLVAERGLPLRSLLVVSFTEASAAELRDRIGRRLQEALACLERPEREPADAVLAAWLQGRSAAADLPAGADDLRGRLLLALEELDAADITTIHGFCRRSLQRHALEAGLPPRMQLELDGQALIEQVVHDYWQGQVLQLPPALLAGLRRGRGLTPQRLRAVLSQLDGDPSLQPAALPAWLPLEQPLQELLPARWSSALQQFRTLWAEGGAALEVAVCEAAAQWRASGCSTTKPYSPKPRNRRADLVDQLLVEADPGYERLLACEPLREYFHPGVFARAARRAEGSGTALRLPQPELLQALAELVDGPAEALLLHAAHWGLAELRRRRARSGSLGFSQLLEALDPGPAAAGPTALLASVAQRYRVALIDEFQDTDPVQWRILSRCFIGPEHLLVMVGDPKQAIYRFRGGDLATYLLARDRADACWGLSGNRRSSPALVAALNVLMRPGLRRSGLEVPAVEACAERSGPEQPLQLLWLGGERAAGEKPPSRTELERRLPALVAAHVVELLQAPPLLSQSGRPRPLRADDICLLVSNHRQAEALRTALARCGVASRLVSRADVFASEAATALQRFLDALADPADGRRLRLLAASPLLGWSAARIAATDAEGWSTLAGDLERLARRLPQQGLLGVLAERLGSEVLAQLVLGGRLLADLQQVAGLVQERLHADRPGAAAAADWLRRLRHDPDRSVPEEHQTHSDRVDGAVSVVTIHRSKGLEYPLVICPYLWQAAGSGSRRAGAAGVRWQPPGSATAQLCLRLDPHWGDGHAADRFNAAAEDQERERLAYVAATRAQHRLVLAWGPADGQEAAPLLPWLFDRCPAADADADDAMLAARSDADWLQLLEQELARRALPLSLLIPGPAAATAAAVTSAAGSQMPGEPPLACGPVPRHGFDRRWGRHSYTSWTHAGARDASPAATDEGRDTDALSRELPEEEAATATASEPASASATASAAARSEETGPLAFFPRGAAAGDCLHRILEQIRYGESVAEGAAAELVERELRRAGFDPGEHAGPLLAGLERLRLTPFGGALGTVRLADLPAGGWINEMSFDLSLGLVRARQLAAAFREHSGGPFGDAYATRLEELPVESTGFLTGAIDLVFAAPAADDPPGAEPRWWVGDWKSNWLGERDSEGRPLRCGPCHFGPEAVQRLMAANHYPLQAHLYLVVLHRYLRWRLPGYDPARHLGGYVYLFLRGVPGPLPPNALRHPVPGMVVERPPLARLLALDAALGSGAEGLGP